MISGKAAELLLARRVAAGATPMAVPTARRKVASAAGRVRRRVPKRKVSSGSMATARTQGKMAQAFSYNPRSKLPPPPLPPPPAKARGLGVGGMVRKAAPYGAVGAGAMYVGNRRSSGPGVSGPPSSGIYGI